VDAEGGSRNTSDINTGQETVFIEDQSGNQIPFIKETLRPEIAGVMVVTQGGGDAKIISEITEAIVALFGIDEHKIKIVKMIS
jgi:stage III sporulation protein AG